MPLRINARAQLCDNLPINFNAALEDELLALAPAGDSRGGEHFLQPLTGFMRRMQHVIGPRGYLPHAVFNS